MSPDKLEFNKTGSTSELLKTNLVCRFCDSSYWGFPCSPCPYCKMPNAGDPDPVAASKYQMAKLISLGDD